MARRAGEGKGEQGGDRQTNRQTETERQTDREEGKQGRGGWDRKRLGRGREGREKRSARGGTLIFCEALRAAAEVATGSPS